MSVNQWKIDQALSSFHQLADIVGELTEEEVFKCLELEAATRRRKTVIDRLISRAVRINEIRYSNQLKGKYHGTSTIESSERS